MRRCLSAVAFACTLALAGCGHLSEGGAASPEREAIDMPASAPASNDRPAEPTSASS